jgi:hypothetical protein
MATRRLHITRGATREPEAARVRRLTGDGGA